MHVMIDYPIYLGSITGSGQPWMALSDNKKRKEMIMTSKYYKLSMSILRTKSMELNYDEHRVLIGLLQVTTVLVSDRKTLAQILIKYRKNRLNNERNYR